MELFQENIEKINYGNPKYFLDDVESVKKELSCKDSNYSYSSDEEFSSGDEVYSYSQEDEELLQKVMKDLEIQIENRFN